MSLSEVKTAAFQVVAQPAVWYTRISFQLLPPTVVDFDFSAFSLGPLLLFGCLLISSNLPSVSQRPKLSFSLQFSVTSSAFIDVLVVPSYSNVG